MKKFNFIKGFLGLIMICALLGGCGKIEDVDNDNEKMTLYNDYPEFDTAQDIVEASDYIFSGIVEEITYQELYIEEEGDIENNDPLLDEDSKQNPIPYTIYEIKVNNIYKGSLDKTFKIKRAGGEYDGKIVNIDGAVKITKGTEYLFLAKDYSGTIPSLVTISQGVYEMNQPNKEDINDITLKDIVKIFNKQWKGRK